MTRRLEYMALDVIAPAATNAKQHAPGALEASMTRFGYLEPMILDERTGRLVAGHGRREELLRRRTAGEDPPEGIRVRGGVWQAPVIRGWSSTSDAEAETAGIALNRLVELGGWDEEALDVVLTGWEEAGEPLVAVGYDQDGLDDLRAFLEERGPAGDGDPDPYADHGVRSIILDYPLADFERITATCQRLRAARGVATNAELIRDVTLEAARR